MPGIWRAGMAILVVCLLLAMVIAVYQLATTPNEILGDGFRDLPAKQRR